MRWSLEHSAANEQKGRAKTLKELIAASAPGFALHGFTISYQLGMQLACGAIHL